MSLPYIMQNNLCPASAISIWDDCRLLKVEQIFITVEWPFSTNFKSAVCPWPYVAEIVSQPFQAWMNSILCTTFELRDSTADRMLTNFTGDISLFLFLSKHLPSRNSKSKPIGSKYPCLQRLQWQCCYHSINSVCVCISITVYYCMTFFL